VLVVEYGEIQYGPGTFDPPAPAASRWTFSSLPNPEVNNKTALVVAGQVVGGSSVVNGMFFDRPSRFDHDSWTEAGGREFESSGIKWNWEGIFPYFKKVVGHEEARGWLPDMKEPLLLLGILPSPHSAALD
jgi:choline dehydrogenase-like flavoprotein